MPPSPFHVDQVRRTRGETRVIFGRCHGFLGLSEEIRYHKEIMQAVWLYYKFNTYFSTITKKGPNPFHRYFKLAKLPFLVAKSICYKKKRGINRTKSARFRYSEPILTAYDFVGKSGWTTNSKGLKRNQLSF